MKHIRIFIWKFSFFVVEFSVYLNIFVFVMDKTRIKPQTHKEVVQQKSLIRVFLCSHEENFASLAIQNTPNEVDYGCAGWSEFSLGNMSKGTCTFTDVAAPWILKICLYTIKPLSDYVVFRAGLYLYCSFMHKRHNLMTGRTIKFITKTHLYSFDPLKPHCYVVKLGFTGVYIIFLITAQNIDCGTR